MRVLTVGCFDCLHEGHANLLKAMRLWGDDVVVGLHSDIAIWKLKGRMPVQNFGHRHVNLQLAGLADLVLRVNSEDPTHFIAQNLAEPGPWLYMRADDMPDFPGKQAVLDAGVDIIYHPYTEGVSSTGIRPPCTSPS